MILKWREGKNPSLSKRLAFSLSLSLLAVMILATATAALTSYFQSIDNQDETPSQDFPEKLFEPIEHKFELNTGESLVHDERGVRLVVEHDEDSD